MEKYEVDGNCLIIFGNCHDINSSSSNNGTDNYDSYGNDLDQMTTKQRSQANARERFRTHRFIESFTSLTTKKLNQELKNFSHHSVNSAFNTLRLLIPTEPKNRKLSKIETLRLAKSYISHLNATLATGKFCAKMIYSFLLIAAIILFSPLFLTSIKEILHVDNHALKHQLYKSISSSIISIRNNMIIVQISAHSVFPQSFIKRGLIKDYL
jgi:hypothetical protein